MPALLGIVSDWIGGMGSMGADKHVELHTMAVYAGDPTNNLVPQYIGQFCHDTSNDDLYWAHGLLAANWKIAAT